MKNPVQACEVMMKNIELWQRALEIKNNNKFGLIGEKLDVFQATASSLLDKLEKKLNFIVKELSSLVKLNSNNTPLAIKRSQAKTSSEASNSSTGSFEEIILNDSPVQKKFKTEPSSVVQKGPTLMMPQNHIGFGLMEPSKMGVNQMAVGHI